MLSPCVCTNESKAAVGKLLGVGASDVEGLEIEFRELPYFLVARSQARWIPGEDAPSINEIQILAVSERGLIIDPRDRECDAVRRVLIPWQNIISLSLSGAVGAPAGGR